MFNFEPDEESESPFHFEPDDGTVVATTFADPADVEAFHRAKAIGLSDQEAFKVGDNGVGKWGDDTTRTDDPIVALPRDLPGVAHNRRVEVTGPDGRAVVARVADVMPKRENIKNGAGIDLNPAAAQAIGATSGRVPVNWRFIDTPVPALAAPTGRAFSFEPDKTFSFEPDEPSQKEGQVAEKEQSAAPGTDNSKRTVGVGESLVRGVKDAVYSVPQLVNTGLGLMPVIVDAAAGTVGLDPKVQQRWHDLMVAPPQQERETARINPETEEQGMAAQIASTVGPLARDATLATVTSGAAPLAEGAVLGAGALRSLMPAIVQGAGAMAVPAGIAGMTAQNAARAEGKSEGEALVEGAAAQAKLTALGALPLATASGAPSIVRRFAERTAKAFPLVAGQNEAVRAAEALARGEAYEFDPQRMVVESLPLTIMAGAAGQRTPAKPRGETLKSLQDLPDDIVPPADNPPPAIEWESREGSRSSAPLSISKDDRYVISHRPDSFTTTHLIEGYGTATGGKVDQLGTFKTLDEAKAASEAHRVTTRLAPPSEIMSPGPGAASALEPLASYEKRSFGERFQKDQEIAIAIRENTGNRYYEPITNKATVEDALRYVETRPVPEVIAAVQDPAHAIPMHSRVAMGQLLIKRLNKAFKTLEKDDPQAAETVLNQSIETAEWLDQYGTELGQGVQQFSVWSQLSPEGKIASLRRKVQKARDRHTAETGTEVAEVIDAVKQAKPNPKRVEQLRKQFTRENKTATKLKRKEWERLAELADAGLLTDQTFYEAASERLGLPQWDRTTAAAIARLAAKIEEAPEGMRRDRATAELSKYLAQHNGFDALDLPIGIYYANMLSGYNTQAVNALDTFLNVSSELSGLALANPRAAARIYGKALRGFLEGRIDFLSTLASGRSVTAGKWLEMPKLMEIARFGEKGGVPINVKSRTDAVIKAVAESRPAAVLNGWKYVGRLMMASDALLFRGAYEGRVALLADRVARTEGLKGRALDLRVEELMGHSELQTHRYTEQAKAEGFTGRDLAQRVAELRNMNRSMDARAEATDFAGLATYNHEPKGWIGYAANSLGAAATKYPALKLFVPFTRIVANVTNRGLNYTPLGFKRAFYGYERGDTVTADERAAMLARATMGTVGISALLGMQSAGYIEINGQGPSDPDRRRQLEAAGWKPYSLRIGDKYWSYVYTPIGLGMSVVGNVSDSYRYREMDEKTIGVRTAYAFSRIGSTIFSQSFLSGLSNLFNALGKPEQSLPAMKNILASTAGTLTTPRIILDMQRIFDSRRFQSTTIGGELLRNTPFAALANRPALNAFGEPTTYPSNRFISEMKNDPAWQLIVRKNLRVPVPDKYTEMPDGKGERRRITTEEYYELLERSGKDLKQYIMERMAGFQAADQETAQKALNTAAAGYRGKWVYELRQRALR